MSAIVIIDDQSISRQILTAVIGSIKSQHEIVGFTGAKEAYDWAIRNPVALAVTDFKMSEMSGIEFIHQFRQHPAGTHVPVIMISGDLNVRAAALGAGANHFMLKPVDHQECREVCRSLLGNVVQNEGCTQVRVGDS